MLDCSYCVALLARVKLLKNYLHFSFIPEKSFVIWSQVRTYSTSQKFGRTFSFNGNTNITNCET